MRTGKPRAFAEGTTVDVTSSQEQIKRLVTLHGATGFVLAEGTDDDGRLRAMIQFRIRGRILKYQRSYPEPTEAPASTRDRHQWRLGEWRRRWRALHLIIKAKLELVASGDVEFDREFLADIMLPDGTTMGAQAVPAIEAAYENGQMPRLMPGDQ